MLEAQILKGKSGKIKICFHIITISTIMLAYISVQSNTFIGNVFLLNKEHVEELQVLTTATSSSCDAPYLD